MTRLQLLDPEEAPPSRRSLKAHTTRLIRPIFSSYSVPTDTDTLLARDQSILELEYEQALRLKKPVLIFVIKDEVPWPADKIDFDLGPKNNLGHQEYP